MAGGEDEQKRLQRMLAQGKMFRKMSCDRCGGRFYFTESARVTRIPVCPNCGSCSAHEQAA
jgi:NAD-dependent SIR2 family protein deacetylase